MQPISDDVKSSYRCRQVQAGPYVPKTARSPVEHPVYHLIESSGLIQSVHHV